MVKIMRNCLGGALFFLSISLCVRGMDDAAQREPSVVPPPCESVHRPLGIRWYHTGPVVLKRGDARQKNSLEAAVVGGFTYFLGSNAREGICLLETDPLCKRRSILIHQIIQKIMLQYGSLRLGERWCLKPWFRDSVLVDGHSELWIFGCFIQLECRGNAFIMMIDWFAIPSDDSASDHSDRQINELVDGVVLLLTRQAALPAEQEHGWNTCRTLYICRRTGSCS